MTTELNELRTLTEELLRQIEWEKSEHTRTKAALKEALKFDPVRDLENFHKKFKLEYEGLPRELPEDMSKFRRLFMVEELEEYNANVYHARVSLTPETFNHFLEEQLDALVDLVYVALGTAYLHGFDFKEAWRRVHNANMSKCRVLREEDSKRGSIYDVVKPKGWQPPDHRDLVVPNTRTKDTPNES